MNLSEKQLIYLIRHGEPDFKDGIRRCIGDKTDIGLSDAGTLQAKKLKPALEGVVVYSSPLKRAYNTAKRATDSEPKILNGVKEMCLGEFEGLSFEEIAEKYPEIYARRGEDWSYPPPGAEEYSSAQKRATEALNSIEEKEAAVITHDGIIRSLLVKYGGLNPKEDPMQRQPYCGISVLKRKGDGFEFAATGVLPDALPDEKEIDEIRKALSVPENISAHMDAVAKKTAKLCESLNAAGLDLNADLAVTAAKLHDIFRIEGREHPKAARNFLCERGYLALGNIISKHHDLDFKGEVDEASVLYLADKFIDGVQEKSLHSRFSKSSCKCITQEALEKHEKRYRTALEIEEKVKSAISGRV